MCLSLIQLRVRPCLTLTLSLVGCVADQQAGFAQPRSNHPNLTTLSPDSARLLKRPYSLFQPVPHALLRDLSTDRPDVTESAYSVDAGHFQLETDLVRLVRQPEESTPGQEIDVNAINLKMGLSRATDLELIVNSYSIQRQQGQSPTYQQGFGDLTLRMKRNLWGNDGGATALSLLPFVKIPTGRAVGNHAWEGGIVAPFAWQLPHDWTFGSQLQATLNRDVDAKTYFVQLAPTLTVGHDIYRTLGGFVELAG